MVEFYLARFNAQGNCLWMRHIGGANPFSIFSEPYNFYLAADEEGNVYAEASADTLFLGDTTLIGPSNFLIKFSKAGDRLFVRKIPVAGLIAIQGSRVYLAGGVGVAIQFDNISLPPLGSSDAFVFELDTNGVVQWGSDWVPHALKTARRLW